MNLKAIIEQVDELDNAELNSLKVKYNRARADKRPFNKIVNRMKDKIGHILKNRREWEEEKEKNEDEEIKNDLIFK